MRATCPAHLIPLALITLTILGEEYKPCSSSLRSFLQPPVTSSLFGPKILLSTILNHDIKVFKPALKDYLLSHSCSIKEFTSIENY
jgi:hypothetical protein